MLNRRYLRIKVLQLLYAFFQSGSDRMDIAEKNLLKSIQKIYELFVYQLSLLVELLEFAEFRTEEAKKKFIPSQEDLNPNLKFVQNNVLNKLRINNDLKRYVNAYKINWADEREMIRKIYQDIRESYDYKKYMNSDSVSMDEEKNIITLLYKKHITRSAILQNFYEEKNIFWTEDFHTVNVFVLKALGNISADWDENMLLPSLYKSTGDEQNEDKEFLVKLFRKTVMRSSEYKPIIADRARNWELDRIAIMDYIIITMAVTELLDFPSIPVKVTLNEYIDISKMYSTPKSKIFVNGILDKLLAEMKTNKQIQKKGRGLMES